MNDTRFLPDDPTVTAYALGELEGAERAVVEAAVRADPVLRAAVEEIRATAARLEAALAGEGAGAAETAPAPARGGGTADPYARHRRARLLRFPQVYFVVGGLAAACFAVLAVLRPPPPAPAPAMALATGKTYVDMSTLIPPAGPAAVQLPAAESRETTGHGGGDAVVATAIPATAPRTLLEQTKAIDESTAGQTPLTLQLSAPAMASAAGAAVAPGPARTGRAGRAGAAVAGAAGRSPQDAPMNVQPAAVGGGGGRSITYLPDDKFVVEARAAGQPAVRPPAGLAANGRDGAIVNESRGTPGASLKEIFRDTEFADTVAAPPPATSTAGGGLLFLSPFTVSADRFRGRVGTSTGAATAAPVLAPRAPTAMDDVIELPTRATRGLANTEAYAFTAENGFVSAAQHPFSTFSVDADTASYANVRRFLQGGHRPPRDAVRIEELLNYFPYRYPPPAAKSDAPFATSLEVAEAPWAPGHRLVRIGLKGREVTTAERPAANLVFLLDVSGSMNAPNRLPLVKESMRMLVAKLRADDRVAIVTYAGQSGLALASTPVARASEIVAALDTLAPGGATNGGMGIQLAYDIAKANLVDGGINRVILCTDGDFNVGVTSEGELVRLIQEKAKSGVFLTVLGFGMGNLKDSTLEKLADKGNGNYGYIDSRKEAEKLLVQQVNGTLVTIAKDVKIQVEFNPSQVASYRLIGYENRRLAKEDFANDKVDAGEIGAGHTVTALYEVIPAGAAAKATRREPEVEERRYNFYGGVTDNATVPGRIDPFGKEMLMVKVRYKKPDGLLSRRLDFPLTDAGGKFANASPDFKFAAAVAGFGMILRESPHKGTATMAHVIEWAEAGTDEDPGGYRSEFLELARHADAPEK